MLIEKLSEKHLVEEQDEVNGEDHKQSQKTKDVEIASQVVLQRRAKCFIFATLTKFPAGQSLSKNVTSFSYQHFGFVDFKPSKEAGHECRSFFLW